VSGVSDRATRDIESLVREKESLREQQRALSDGLLAVAGRSITAHEVQGFR
jgi:hypothetical protein